MAQGGRGHPSPPAPQTAESSAPRAGRAPSQLGQDRPLLPDPPGPHLYSATAELLAESQSGIHHPFQVSLQAPSKVSEHGGASGKNDVLEGKAEVPWGESPAHKTAREPTTCNDKAGKQDTGRRMILWDEHQRHQGFRCDRGVMVMFFLKCPYLLDFLKHLTDGIHVWDELKHNPQRRNVWVTGT